MLHTFTTRKRSLGQGNVLTPVCQSLCSQGGVSQYAVGRSACIPACDWAGGCVSQHATGQSAVTPTTVNKRAIRILLECFLVCFLFFSVLSLMQQHNSIMYLSFSCIMDRGIKNTCGGNHQIKSRHFSVDGL